MLCRRLFGRRWRFTICWTPIVPGPHINRMTTSVGSIERSEVRQKKSDSPRCWMSFDKEESIWEWNTLRVKSLVVKSKYAHLLVRISRQCCGLAVTIPASAAKKYDPAGKVWGCFSLEFRTGATQ